MYVCKQMNRLSFWGSLLLLCCLCLSAKGQLGGNSSFQILQSVSPARMAAMGGNVLAVKDADLNIGFYTPSLLDSTASGQVALGFNRIFGEASLSHAAYAHHVRGLGTLSFGIVSLNYGQFDYTDEAGNILGNFNAGEYLFQAGIARQLDAHFSIGANAKFAMSEMAELRSTALLIDLSATYYNPSSRFTATAVIRNVGRTLSAYRPGIEQQLPFEIQAGVSKRLDKAPIRFGINYENMQVWRLSEDRSGQFFTDPLTGEQRPVDNDAFLETFARHLIFHTELLLSENFHIRFGYNYNRRQELKIESRPGGAGFTFGFGLKVSKFHLSYGRATYNLAGATNHFGLSMRFDDFRKEG